MNKIILTGSVIGAMLFTLAAVSYSFAEIAPETWTRAVGICTSNGDVTWSAAMLVIALVFMLAGRARSPRNSETRPRHESARGGEISQLITRSVSASLVKQS
jgi:hypothetical protein